MFRSVGEEAKKYSERVRNSNGLKHSLINVKSIRGGLRGKGGTEMKKNKK